MEGLLKRSAPVLKGCSLSVGGSPPPEQCYIFTLWKGEINSWYACLKESKVTRRLPQKENICPHTLWLNPRWPLMHSVWLGIQAKTEKSHVLFESPQQYMFVFKFVWNVFGDKQTPRISAIPVALIKKILRTLEKCYKDDLKTSQAV